MSPAQGIWRSLRWWAAGYVVLLCVVIGAMFWSRPAAESESVAQWQAWREGVRQEQSGPKVVARRIPESNEPPALVLMRDYFIVLTIGAVVFSSLLYWIMVWFIRGIFAGSSI